MLSKKLKKKEVITPEVVAAIDRCGISDQHGMIIMSSTLNALGQDISKINLSRATIAKRRKFHRPNIESEIKNAFESVDSFLTLHYDEKKMLDTTNGVDKRNVLVNRLAVVVSHFNGYKLIEIPKIKDGKGLTVAKGVFSSLQKWNLMSKIGAICFDTTSSNSGWREGSAVHLEKMMKKPLLFFACRHHIAELLLKKAFALTVEPDSAAPVITICKRFQKAWPKINIDPEKIQANSAMNDNCIAKFFPPRIRNCLIQFANKQLNAFHERADYADFAHMVLLLLGEKVLDSKGNFRKIKVPGAFSRARFMAMSNYGLKMYLFRDQFELTGE